jgi:hypothetical protein
MKPRAENPSDVIVTTESRTDATTSARSRGSLELVWPDDDDTVTAPGVADCPVAPPLGTAVIATSAAVPPAARTADRSDVATIVRRRGAEARVRVDGIGRDEAGAGGTAVGGSQTGTASARTWSLSLLWSLSLIGHLRSVRVAAR